ncbi:MAG TPA: prohibitin family protein [Kofleriaceae bacterium]|jgi:regulator of protease activity HflC (stomatin/prohibitin superfamily)|nr:prohibitin family protein [Kofleriaceae bacterium]
MKRTLVLVLLVAGCASSVPAGNVGLFVYASRGLDKQVLAEGLYWHWPWNQILLFPSQWNEYEEKMHVLTQDDVHLEVQAGIAIRPKVAELYHLQQDLGARYYDTVVQSAFFTATRTVLAHYNMVDLPENSEKIENEIRAHVEERIAGHHLELGRIALQHIDYPPTVQAAIEQRLVVQQQQTQKEAEIKIASQEAQIAHIRAESAAANAQIAATSDAETTKIRAEGEAKAQAMLGKTLTPLLVQLRALTSPASKFVFVPEGRQLSVVLGGDATGGGGGVTGASGGVAAGGGAP